MPKIICIKHIKSDLFYGDKFAVFMERQARPLNLSGLRD